MNRSDFKAGMTVWVSGYMYDTWEETTVDRVGTKYIHLKGDHNPLIINRLHKEENRYGTGGRVIFLSKEDLLKAIKEDTIMETVRSFFNDYPVSRKNKMTWSKWEKLYDIINE